MQTTTGAGYDVDFVLWAESQAAALREGRFADLDIENVSEEIEGLARRDRSKLRSRLARLVEYLLKLEYQPEKATRSWRVTIFEQASAFWEILEESPSLKSTIEEVTAVAYETSESVANSAIAGADWLVADLFGGSTSTSRGDGKMWHG